MGFGVKHDLHLPLRFAFAQSPVLPYATQLSVLRCLIPVSGTGSSAVAVSLARGIAAVQTLSSPAIK